MRIEKEHMDLENIDEIRIYNAPKKDFYIPTPQEFDIDEILMSNLIDNIPVDIHTFIPYENGKAKVWAASPSKNTIAHRKMQKEDC